MTPSAAHALTLRYRVNGKQPGQPFTWAVVQGARFLATEGVSHGSGRKLAQD